MFSYETIIDNEAPIVKRLAGVINQVQKTDPTVGSFNATCEAPFLSIDKGIPTVIFGPGNLKQAHIANEYVELIEVEKAAIVYTLLALNLPRS